MRRTLQTGLTLVELSVTLSVAATLATGAVSGFSDLLHRHRTEGVAAELATDLQYARTAAVARNEGVRVRFQADASGTRCYLIHTGPANACSCLVGTATACVGDGEVLKAVVLPADGAVQVSANVASMLYDPTRGTVTPTATLSVRAANGQQLNHVVNLLGRVRTCAATAGWSSHRPC